MVWHDLLMVGDGPLNALFPREITNATIDGQYFCPSGIRIFVLCSERVFQTRKKTFHGWKDLAWCQFGFHGSCHLP